MGLVARMNSVFFLKPVNAQARKDVVADDSMPAWKQKMMFKRLAKSAIPMPEEVKMPRVVSINGKKIDEQGDDNKRFCPKCGMRCLNVASHLKNVHGIA